MLTIPNPAVAPPPRIAAFSVSGGSGSRQAE